MNHWYVYGGVPAEGEGSLSVDVSPCVMLEGEAVGAGTAIAVFTVTCTGREFWTMLVVAESVTCSSNSNVPIGVAPEVVNAYEEEVAPGITENDELAGPLRNHW